MSDPKVKKRLPLLDAELHDHQIFPQRIPDYVQYRHIKNWYFRWMARGVVSLAEEKITLAFVNSAKLPRMEVTVFAGNVLAARVP